MCGVLSIIEHILKETFGKICCWIQHRDFKIECVFTFYLKSSGKTKKSAEWEDLEFKTFVTLGDLLNSL